MEIYVVQPGDTIYSIAYMYEISVDRLILDNGLDNPYELVIGQTIVIAYPKQEHIVEKGETLDSIANTYQVSIIQLLQNNSQIIDLDSLYEGESLVISYPTTDSIITHGIAYPYIKRETLARVLPNLTYLSIFNYTAVEGGNIKTYYDDSEIIQLAKQYRVIPILMITTLTPQGEHDIETSYNIIINEEYQENHNNQLLEIMKTKGYMGVHIVINYIRAVNQSIYFKFIKKLSKRCHENGYLLYVTFNVDIGIQNSNLFYEQIDYAALNDFVDGMMFLQLVWSVNKNPPSPVTNISIERNFLSYVASTVSPDKLILGTVIISYDWQLPYIPSQTRAYALTMDSTIKIANESGAIIQFDESSETPFFFYNQITLGMPTDHIVWTIDARTIDAQFRTMKDYGISSFGIWNVMVYYYQMWTMIHSQYNILKLI